MATAKLTSVGLSIRNVLIATDFSRFSNLALNFGLELAHGYQAKAEVVFVVPTDEFALAGPEAYVAARDAAQRDLLELKDELRKTHPGIEGEDYQLVLLEGPVAETILSFAHQKKIDLIVLGTHGRSALGKMLMGSVAERVFRQSPVPVLTIGPHVRRPTRRTTPKNILLAADFTLAGERASHYAANMAREHGAKLTLLHVVDEAALQPGADSTDVLHGMETKLGDLLGEDAAGLRFCCQVEVGKVVSTILHTASETDADLLVLGVRPWTGVLDRFMWPHAYEIVREASCPVLTVRSKSLQH